MKIKYPFKCQLCGTWYSSWQGYRQHEKTKMHLAEVRQMTFDIDYE